jgi:hypothetical protein
MTYTKYHVNILKKNDGIMHKFVESALYFIPDFENAIVKVINDGDWESYVKGVTNYDKFLWQCNHLYPQKTNPINILQNKKYSSYRETLLSPLWFRIQNRIPFKTEVLVNKSIIQTLHEDNTFNYKDIDGGLGIKHNDFLLPVVVNEDKSGHFCKTQAKNVNGILRVFEDTNDSILRVCTTDNKVSIGKGVDSSDLSSFNIVASVRENNGGSSVYNKLNSSIFEKMESEIINYLTKKSGDAFSIDKYKIKSKQNRSIRESIDNTGIYINI